MPQLPALRRADLERAPHLVLRPGAYAATGSEMQPMPRLEAESHRKEDRHERQRKLAGTCDDHGEQHGDASTARRGDRASQPAILLTACVGQSTASLEGRRPAKRSSGPASTLGEGTVRGPGRPKSSLW